MATAPIQMGTVDVEEGELSFRSPQTLHTPPLTPIRWIDGASDSEQPNQQTPSGNLRHISYYGTSTPDASIPGTPSSTPLRPRTNATSSAMLDVFFAAENGDTGMVEQALVQLGPLKAAALTAPDPTTGCSVLHAGCAGGNPAVVELLLRHRADPAARTGSAATPLHFAASAGSHKAASVMLDAGLATVDPNVKDVHGCMVHVFV